MCSMHSFLVPCLYMSSGCSYTTHTLAPCTAVSSKSERLLTIYVHGCYVHIRELQAGTVHSMPAPYCQVYALCHSNLDLYDDTATSCSTSMQLS